MGDIALQDLRKEFGSQVAVDDFTLHIRDGELMVLLGPTACGKTTLLNCIAGLEKPTRGKILFDGEDVTDLPPHVRNTAMVFQFALLYPHLTGQQNILMSLKKARLPREAVEARINEVTSLLGIAGVLHKIPSQMSGGERQRVAIAKAIVRNPRAFLLDEPMAALDAVLRLTLRAELANLQKRLGVTTVYVTHDQVEALTIGDRVAVMRSGRLQQVGRPDEVYGQPVNLFVARFVGTPPMNFLKGSLVETDAQLHFVSEDVNLTLPYSLSKQIRIPDHRRVVLGIRPQDTAVAKVEEPEAWKARVFATEYLGVEEVVILEREPGQRFRTIADRRFGARVGETLWVRLNKEAIILFDAESELNLRLPSSNLNPAPSREPNRGASGV